MKIKERLSRFWNSILYIGHSDRMNQKEEMRLFTLNAFALIASFLTFLFVVVFTTLSSYRALQGRPSRSEPLIRLEGHPQPLKA